MVIFVYKSEVYDQLGDVEIVAKMVSEKHIRGVGKIIVEYGYQEDVLVALAHKHFALTEDEIMLETSLGDTRISKPANRNMIDVFEANPNLIACYGNNAWYPIGYDAESKEMPKAFTDDKFLQKVANYLIQNGLQEKLVLGARGKDMKDDVLYVERNYQDTRTSEIKPGDIGEGANSVKTTFGFKNDPEGKLVASSVCVCVFCMNVHRIG